MAARVEPAHGGAREALGRLRAVRGGDGGILTAVDEEDGQVEGGDGAPVVGARSTKSVESERTVASHAARAAAVVRVAYSQPTRHATSSASGAWKHLAMAAR